MNEELSIRDTARGVAVRGGILLAGGLLVGGWLAGVAFKVAGKAVHLLLMLGLALIGAAFATYEVKKIQRRFDPPEPVI